MKTSETRLPPTTVEARPVGKPKAKGRAAITTGIAGVIVFLLAWVDQPALENGASGQAARRFLESHLQSVELSVLAQTAGLIAFLVFVLGIQWLMRQADGNEKLLCDLTLLCGGLVLVWFWLQASIDALPLVLADDSGKLTAYSDSALVVLEPLTRLGETLGDVATVPRGVLMLAISLHALRTRFSPRSVGVVGVVVGAVSLLGATAAWAVPIFGAAVLVGLFGFYFWVLLLSLALLVAALRRR